ncbi:MAG: class I SAM-dependent methyltransferase [Thermodesulfobacteriota bacterium]
MAGPAAVSEKRIGRVCPWWLGYTFDNPIRRMIHPPEKILGPYVREGMTVLDVGAGFGHFSIGMARLVGETGEVIAADVQEKMLEKTLSRARKAGVERRIKPLPCRTETLGLHVDVDFALACNVLHEMPDLPGLFAELQSRLKPNGLFFVMEPAGHVGAKAFEKELALALAAGFQEQARPRVFQERCVLLTSAHPETLFGH